MSLTDPSLALQGAIVAALKGDAGVSAIVAARVFDQVGRNPDGSPSRTIGESPGRFLCGATMERRAATSSSGNTECVRNLRTIISMGIENLREPLRPVNRPVSLMNLAANGQ